ncbi:MAG: ribonuclease H family protein [Campylobacterota bacterium]
MDPHIKLLRAKCLNSINILKYLAHPRTGCNRKLLLQLYKSLIRSQLDNGAPIYSQSSKSSLKLSDTIQSSALRLALGALRSSPILSLCAEAGEPPLKYRFLTLTANFLASTAQFPQLPIYTPALCPQNSLLLPIESQICKKLRLKPLLPILSSIPPWLIPPPDIRLDLTNEPKTDNTIYRQLIQNIISSKFPTHQLCFTDGSKSGPKTGYAYSIQGTITNHRLRNSASIFTAELHAIYSCLSHLTLLTPHLKFLLLTDSLSSLLAMQEPHSTNPIVQRIHLLLHILSSTSISVSFLWIPGHINLPEHDAVDLAAKDSLHFHTISDPIPTPTYDLKNYYRSLILTSWHESWKNEPSNKLRKVKNKPIPWTSSNRPSRHEEIILTRLRIGHTRLTHSYLFLGLHAPPSCQYCQYDYISVKHFFLCPALENIRHSHSVSSFLPSALCNNSNTISNSLNYLRSTYFYPLL